LLRAARLEDHKALIGSAAVHQGDTMPAIRTIAAAAVAAASLAVAATPAAATFQSPTDDLSATPCKVDTSPSYPSCGTAESVAIKLGATSYTATPCRLDTSPAYPSCGTQPR
jgi:hypothetical protein